jgi:urate oxidase
MITLAENTYGKSRIRLVQIKRKAGWHELREWTVEMLFRGDFDSCFVEGDNSKILPTDTMKNTVYSLARDSAAGCMEEFAKELIGFLLRGNPQASGVELSISEKAWEHLDDGGAPHPTTFVQASGECQTAKVSRTQEGGFSVRSGLENLVIMKTE